VLAAPRLGAFNMHPGPLPAYAGFNAPSWAVADGETSYAVTVHRMVEAMDAGPIVFEGRFPIGPDDTGLKVATGCIREGLPLLERLLEAADRGEIPELEQEGEGRFTWFETPDEGVLRWELGARRAVDLVRAADYAPYPSPWGTFRTSVDGREVGILRASRSGEPTAEPAGTVGAVDESGALVSAGDEWVRVERAALGGEAVAPADVFRGGAVCVAPDAPPAA
jgi:methionyl-tRNA formyltransferase